MISTGCASAIKNLSALTAHELTKVELDYAIQDTNHILRKIDEINELGALSGVTSVIHASFDIEAMFPKLCSILPKIEAKSIQGFEWNQKFTKTAIFGQNNNQIQLFGCTLKQ